MKNTISNGVNKYLTKYNIGLVILLVIILPFKAKTATNLTNLHFAVSQGWEYGSDDPWHLQPLGSASVFNQGDNIQFFAQAGPIYVSHRWRLVLKREGTWYRELVGDRLNPDTVRGWNYSNYTPTMSDLPAGKYQVEYFLDSGDGYQSLSTINFQVNYSGTPTNYQSYRLDHAVTAAGWEYGTGAQYLNYRPLDQRTSFRNGETVYLLAQIRNINVNHRYKAELYRSGTKQWENATDWISVGSGMPYSNYVTSLPYAAEGSYEFRVFADFGYGFQRLATVPFTVNSGGNNYSDNYSSDRYNYQNTRLANGGWRHGSGSDYWNLRPIGERSSFNRGETVHAISQVRNINIDHQWKAEVYKNGSLVWSQATPWRRPAGTWAYGTYYPSYDNVQPGNYEWRIYLNTGDGWRLLDRKSFTVTTGGAGSYTYTGATVAENWTHGSGGDEYWNIQPVNPRTSFSQGANVFIVAQARDVKMDHRWRVETYRYGSLLWSYTTPWNRVGKGWAFSNFYPANYNSTYGDYQFKIYWDGGNGFVLKDTKNFYVY
jgi:hypothetical protein